jgi:N-acyl-D-aspartate/D-glutamate deacylase
MAKMVDRVSGMRVAFAASIAFLTLGLVAYAWAQSPAPVRYDLVIEGGRVMDPETGVDRIANVGVTGGTIRAISDAPLEGKRKINARGLVVAPGFIDLHAHGQTPSDNDIQARDGVTTALELESGVYPIAPFYTKREGHSRINFGASVSHRGLRVFVATGMESTEMGVDPELSARLLSAQDKWAYPRFDQSQVDRLRDLFRREFAAGGLGMGLAPEYIPGAGRDEVFAMFQEVADLHAPVFVHVRRAETAMGDGPIAPMQEVIADAAATGASLHIVHIGSKALGAIAPILQMIEGARAHGVDVTTEVYPYTASSTRIGSALFDEGWRGRQGAEYSDVEWPATGERLTEESFNRFRRDSPEAFVVVHKISDLTVDTAIANPMVMIASDGVPFVDGAGHPRGAGTFARVLGYYVRERQLLSLMDGLRKMTLMPAQRLEQISPAMRKKGRLQVGADADITIFDPARVIDRATYAKPTTPSDGIPYVLVGGVVIVDRGQIVADVHPGKGIRSGGPNVEIAK